MELTVTDARLAPMNMASSPKVKAFCRVVLNDELQLTGLRVVDGDNGLFVSYPSEPGVGDYKSIFYPITKRLRDHIEEVLLAMYNEGKTLYLETSTYPIKVGDEVTVTPDKHGYPRHEFTGTVTEIKPNDEHGTEYYVEDSEGDTFNCNLTQLTKEQ